MSTTPYGILQAAVRAAAQDRLAGAPLEGTYARLEHAVQEALTEMQTANKTRLALTNKYRDAAVLPSLPDTLDDQIIIRRILESVSGISGITPHDLIGKTRMAKAALPRHAALWLARRYTCMTLTEIGDVFGGRDHSTVIHAINKVEAQRIKGAGRLWAMTAQVDAKLQEAPCKTSP